MCFSSIRAERRQIAQGLDCVAPALEQSEDRLHEDWIMSRMTYTIAEDDNLEEDVMTNPHSFSLDPQLLREYRTFQRSAFDVETVLCIFVLGFTFYISRTNVLNSFSSGFLFRFNMISLMLSVTLYTLLMSGYLLKVFVKDKSNRMGRLSNFLIDGFVDGSLGDVIAILSSVGAGANLYARARAGICPVGVTLWESQECNTSALSSSLPLDHVLLVCLLPLSLQSVIHGMSFRCAICCWVITTFFLMASMIHVSGHLDSYVLISVSIVLILVYKYEKHARQTFAHYKQTSAAKKDKSRHILLQQQAEHQLQFEKSRHELEIISIKLEDERNMMEKEKAQMVALLGNVAHDLKTPLQSFLLNLESLKEIVCIMECKTRLLHFRLLLHCVAFIVRLNRL